MCVYMLSEFLYNTDPDWSNVFRTTNVSIINNIWNIIKANKLSITWSGEVLHTDEIHTLHSHRFYLYWLDEMLHLVMLFRS